MNKPSICFVSLLAYPVIADSGNHNSAGGAEIQQFLIGRELVKRKYRVSFVVGNFGQSPIETHEGIRIIRSFAPYKGMRKLRFPLDFLSMMAACKKADADIFYQRASMFYTPQVAFYCNRAKKKFIYAIGHDRNVDPRLQKQINPIIRYFFKLGLHSADCIISQTWEQKQKLKDLYGLESIVIRSGHELPPDFSISNLSKVILWVGNIQDWKQPEVFLRLAKELPEFNFRMIGVSKGNGEHFRKVQKDAAELKNLEFIGFVLFKDIASYFQDASLLVNTSDNEGFPNTFIQAWLYGVPTLNLNVDPDRLITTRKIGRVSGSFEKLVSDVREVMNDYSLRESMGHQAISYARKNHNIQESVNKYERLITEMLSQTQSSEG